MKNCANHTGILEIISRLPSSVNGNPRYLLRVGDTACKTEVDSNIAYMLPNIDGKPVTAVIGTHYGNATLASIRVTQS